MAKREIRESFADVVRRVKALPATPPWVAPGRQGSTWGDSSGQRAYALVTDDLTPLAAQALVADGAVLVYDACGCGGAECELDWIGEQDAADLAAAGAPVLRPTKDGRADLEHWRSADGRDLVVLAVEVTWGARIGG